MQTRLRACSSGSIHFVWSLCRIRSSSRHELIQHKKPDICLSLLLPESRRSEPGSVHLDQCLLLNAVFDCRVLSLFVRLIRQSLLVVSCKQIRNKWNRAKTCLWYKTALHVDISIIRVTAPANVTTSFDFKTFYWWYSEVVNIGSTLECTVPYILKSPSGLIVSRKSP